MGEAWMTSEIVPRCESCGLRLEEENPTVLLCRSCAYRRKKQEQRAAANPPPPATPVEPTKGPDPAELRERLRRVEEGLRE